MKDCYCPSCGKKQWVALGPQSKVLIPCCSCGKSLTIKLESDALTVRAQNAAVTAGGS